MMLNLTVGKDILSFCNKCKQPTNHLIVSMKDSVTVHKVLCNTCKATHVYKDPTKVKAATKRTRGPKRKKFTPDKPDIPTQWQNYLKVSTQEQASTIAYSHSNDFKKGDMIEHAKFGKGFVDRVIDTSKIQVLFQTEIRTLVHNK